MEQKRRSTVPLTDYIFAKAGRAKLPLSGTFEFSPVCNFTCRMCYVRKTQAEVDASPRKIMTKEQWLSLAEEAKDMGMLFLLLTGGEPLLWPWFWDVYDAVVDMGILVSINTNGSMIDEKAVEHFRRKPPKRINITLYGASDDTYYSLCNVHHMFDRVDKAIRMLQEAGIQVKLNCSLTPHNAHDLEKMVAYSKERNLVLDITTYMFPPIRREGDMFGKNDRFTPEESAMYRMKAFKLQYSEEQYRRYLNDILRGSLTPLGLDESCIDPLDGRVLCRAGTASFWMTWDGKMTPCGMMPEPYVDYKEHGFRKSWEMINQKTLEMKLSGICSNCNNMQLCHSCAAMAYTETGKFTGVPEYLCRTVYEMKRIAEEELKQFNY